jgi:tetrahydromethanopterin S-methyltransferase subunit E
MHDDELMDKLLRDVMAADTPELSPAFDTRVMRRVRPRRLTSIGRVAMAVYVGVAATTTVWLMRDLRLELIATALAVGVPVAAGAIAYGRRLLAAP